jgi:hypothetical protein
MRGLDTIELEPSGSLDPRECFYSFAGGEVSCALVAEADDHKWNYRISLRVMSCVTTLQRFLPKSLLPIIRNNPFDLGLPAEIRGAAATTTFCGDGFCMLEAGDDLAGVAFGDFFHEPSPDVQVKSIGKAWHLGKVLFEKWWLSPWGARRRLLKSALAVGSRIYGVPVNL